MEGDTGKIQVSDLSFKSFQSQIQFLPHSKSTCLALTGRGAPPASNLSISSCVLANSFVWKQTKMCGLGECPDSIIFDTREL